MVSSPTHGACFWGESCLQWYIVSITYDCSNKDADKKGLSLFRLPKDHNLRQTSFKKLRLVDPPNTDNVRVCSEHSSEECFIVDNASCYGVQEDKNRSLTKDAMLSERRAKRAEKKQVVGISY